MKKVLILTVTCIAPVAVFAQAGLVKIGGELGKVAVENSVTKGVGSFLTEGMSIGMLKQMDIPLSQLPTADILKRAAAAAQNTAVSQVSASWAEQLSSAVTVAQQANWVLFEAVPLHSNFAVDTYPDDMLKRIREDARITSGQLSVPLTPKEVDLLFAADTKHEFFEIFDETRDGLLVASFRQRVNINSDPGSWLHQTNMGDIWKLEKTRYQQLQRTLQNWQAKDIESLKARARISFYEGNRKALTYDQFRGLVSTGDSEFFGKPFVAMVQRMNETSAGSVGVFFPVKKNLLVSRNFVNYFVPANSYVCMDQFNGAIDQSRFLFDAAPLMRGFPAKTVTRLQKALTGSTDEPLEAPIMKGDQIPQP